MPTLHVSRRSFAGVALSALIGSAIFMQAHAAETHESAQQPTAQIQGNSPAAVTEASPVTLPHGGEHVAKHIIGATAIIIEPQSQLSFLARVDTGAASCSIHCEQWEIEDESESMEENIGKPIRILLGNHKDEPEWIESQINRCVTVKTSERKESRYKVPLTFRWKNIEKKVVVTLNNRGHMNYPVLLGRNFLEGDFLVDIGQKDEQVTEIAKAD
jgi:hypothetical protein